MQDLYHQPYDRRPGFHGHAGHCLEALGRGRRPNELAVLVRSLLLGFKVFFFLFGARGRGLGVLGFWGFGLMQGLGFRGSGLM